MSSGCDRDAAPIRALSKGGTYEGPKALRRNLKRLKRSSRRLNKTQPGSSNRNKARNKIAGWQGRIAGIRRDALPNLTSAMTRNFTAVSIEGPNCGV